MKVLLINPNTYKSPPVPPIGLEHVAASVERAGHEAEIVDLCFSGTPLVDIDKAVATFGPDIAGITVRNIDTVLYHVNEFFLDRIKEIVAHIKTKHNLKVIIGGAGVATNPEGVLEYLGADYALSGPAEDGICRLLDKIGRAENIGKVHFRKYRFDISCPRKAKGIDYGKYFANGGIAGFETHKGCSSSCVYCSEANTNISFKKVEDVLAEIGLLADAGFTRFHLCDSEFNEDLDYCIGFCEALAGEGLNIDWSLYMKPANYNKRLFRLMKRAGVTLVTLTVDTWKKCPLYYSDIERIIFIAKSCGLKVAVDFLTGFPYEDEETLKWHLDLFRRLQPDSVGINVYIRLYKSLKITDIIMKDEGLKKYLLGDTGDASLVRPVFYNHISVARLEELIAGEDLFRIEGLEKGVNYGRFDSA
jgi:radical SAM superfamily enzyme YgiQ (UPF0313 family)